MSNLTAIKHNKKGFFTCLIYCTNDTSNTHNIAIIAASFDEINNQITFIEVCALVFTYRIIITK